MNLNNPNTLIGAIFHALHALSQLRQPTRKRHIVIPDDNDEAKEDESEVQIASRNEADRALRSKQQREFAAALAIDIARERERNRLSQRRLDAVRRQNSVWGKSTDANDTNNEWCDVRVRLPTGAVRQRRFDALKASRRALLDWSLLEAATAVGVGSDAFDIARYRLVTTFPKQVVAAEVSFLIDSSFVSFLNVVLESQRKVMRKKELLI